MTRLSLLLFICIFPIVNAQDLSVHQIPEELTKNAYAVVRNDETTVEFLSFNKVTEKQEITITILNESGLKYATVPVFYTGSDKTKTYEAVLYNANGAEIKKLKNKDAKDVSVYDGFSLFTDRRVQYFHIVPISYPFTVRYTIESSSSNTISLPVWRPVLGYDVSVEKSNYKLINHTQIHIRKFESGFEGRKINQSENGNIRTYSIQNIPAISDEIYSPDLREVTPFVQFAPTEFQLEGVKGKFENWKEFGKWYYENLLYDKNDLSDREKQIARNLVKGTEDLKEKIKILYQYMQTKTRYINVAIGIGGWEPFPASYVSDKSYGDCKALSNYMVSLLDAVGIKAYHTIVFGESDRKVDFKENFASLQGNHMIVNVPLEDETIWLECTSQQTAFNYLGQFTDDRFALSVSPQGGEIIRTQKFPADSNLEINKIKGEISPTGNLTADFNIQNLGLNYDEIYRISFESSQNQKLFLSSWLDDMPNLKISSYQFENNRDQAIFQTDVKIESQQFAKVFGNNMTINLIPATRLKTSFKKDDNRLFPFDVRFGSNNEMQFELKIPAGFQLAEKFEPILFVSEFGLYSLNLEILDETHFLIKRNLYIKDGTYEKDKFNDYVEFRRKISSFDNSKILIEKT